ncbi:MAG: hypothetical protein RQ745_12770, partial [Longimicrobiales bacterium]|nr:hypothetical protein [Longimicrobiales bacterium]
GVRRRVTTRRLPSLVNCAIAGILNERVREKYAEPDEATVIRTQAELARRCGAHRDTLLRARRQSDIDLGAVMRSWIVALALRERFIEEIGASRSVWLTVARRCGYASESGLRALMGRELGKGLRDVGFGDLHAILDRLEALVERGLGPG